MRDVRADFPLLGRQVGGRRIVYLDSAATSLKPQAVIDAVTAFYTVMTANVHRATHILAEEASEAFEGARGTVARFLGAAADEIIFTRNATEAVNVVRSCFPGLRRTLTTAMEHHSNLLPWGYGEGATVLPVDAQEGIDLAALDSALEGGIDLVAVTHVSNVLGVVAPVEAIIERAHAAGALVLLDAAQSAPHMPVDVRDLDVDFLVCSAHKMLGPGGVGLLYAKPEHLERMTPYQLGGNIVDQVHLDEYTLDALPHRLEAGTPPIEAVIGWGAAVEYLEDLGMDEVAAHDHDLLNYALERLGEIRNLQIIGPRDVERRGPLVSFNVKGLEAHGVARMLNNRANVCVRSGFHCAQPLHETLGLLPTVRASFYVYNEREDIDILVESLQSITSLL